MIRGRRMERKNGGQGEGGKRRNKEIIKEA